MPPGALTRAMAKSATTGAVQLEWWDDALGNIINLAFGDITSSAYFMLRDWLWPWIWSSEHVRFPGPGDLTDDWKVWDYWAQLVQMAFSAGWGAVSHAVYDAYLDWILGYNYSANPFATGVGNLLGYAGSIVSGEVTQFFTDEGTREAWFEALAATIAEVIDIPEIPDIDIPGDLNDFFIGIIRPVYSAQRATFESRIPGDLIDDYPADPVGWSVWQYLEATLGMPIAIGVGQTIGLEGTLEGLPSAAASDVDISLQTIINTHWGPTLARVIELGYNTALIQGTLGDEISPSVGDIARALAYVEADAEEPEDRLKQQWERMAQMIKDDAFDPWSDWLEALGGIVSGIPAGIGTAIGDTLGDLGATAGNIWASVDWSGVAAAGGALGSLFEPLLSTPTDNLLASLPGIRIGSASIDYEEEPPPMTDLTREVETQVWAVLDRMRTIISLGVAGIGGLAAMTIGSNLIHQLKEHGQGHIAAMVWDATGYPAIISGAMAAVFGPSIFTSLRYYANWISRPWLPERGQILDLYRRNRITHAEFSSMLAYHGYSTGIIEMFADNAYTLPGTGDISMMYAKKEITQDEFDNLMHQHGYRQGDVDVYHQYIWLDPRLSELIRISQIYRPSGDMPDDVRTWLTRAGVNITTDVEANWWYYYKIAKAGYETGDIEILVSVAKMAIARREQTLYFGAVRRLRRDGYITAAEAQVKISIGWEAQRPEDFRAMAYEEDYDYYQRAMITDTVLSAYSRGLYSEADAIDALGDLGMDAQRVQLVVLRQKLGLAARISLEAESEEPEILPAEIA